MPNFKGNSGGGPSAMKMYGKGKNPIKMTAAQETLPENLKAGIRAKEDKQAPTKMYDKASAAKMYGKDKNPVKFMGMGAMMGAVKNSMGNTPGRPTFGAPNMPEAYSGRVSRKRK